MRFGKLITLASILLITTSAFASPRIHRGPTCPKLFKSRTPAKPKTQTAAEPGDLNPTESHGSKAGLVSPQSL